MTAISQNTPIGNAEETNEPIVAVSSPPFLFNDYHLNVLNLFPWMADFIQLCHEDMLNANPRSLEKLMNMYHGNVIESLKECSSDPIKASTLRRSMLEVLIFFHMSYSALKSPLEYSSFLDQMTDLVALYIDMEIETWRFGSERLENVASKITSCLFIYFGSSHDHILVTILKTKMINKDSKDLSDLILRRVLRDSPGSSIHVVTYIRYLLSFKLWMDTMGSDEERKKIQLLAVQQLTPPADFKEKLSWGSIFEDILPKIPESENSITQFLLEAEFLDRDKIEMFIRAAADPYLLCSINSPFISANYSCIEDDKEDNEDNWLVDDSPDTHSESDVERSLELNEINNTNNNIRYYSKHGLVSVSENEKKKKLKNDEFAMEGIGIHENISKAVKIEELTEKDQVNQANDFWEGDSMDAAAEVELPSSPVDVTNTPTIKVEPQPSQSKDYILPWDTSSIQSYQNYTDFGSKSEFVIDQKQEKAVSIDLESSKKFFDKEQKVENNSNVEDQSSASGFDLIHSKQVPIESKSVNVSSAEEISIENYIPLTPKSISFKNNNTGTVCEERNEEISSEEQNEELSLEDYNEVIDIGEISRSSQEESISEGKISGEYFPGKDVQTPSEQNLETPPEIRGLVHDFTLKNDNKIYKFHVKLSSYWEKLNRHTWISLLFPLFSEQKIKTPRCNCFLCAQNYNIIMKNWKSALTNLSRLPTDFFNTEMYSGNFDNSILDEMKESLETNGLKLLVWEPELEEVHTKIEELIKKENKYSNLPLKKRKAFSFNTYVKEEEKEISYPNTPMISIAELELVKDSFRFNAMNMNHPSSYNPIPPPLNYMPDYLSHPDYPILPDIKCDELMAHSGVANIPSDETQLLEDFAFTPEDVEQNRPKFKTPAELKEFQHLSAAEDLINFSLSSRAYYNANQEPRKENEREKRKTRNKIKSSRKRKRTPLDVCL